MLGIVMTEVLEFVETHLGFIALEEMLEEADLPGVYTIAGAYPDSDVEEIVSRAAKSLGEKEGVVLIEFGRSLLPRLLARFPEYQPQPGQLFEFLAEVENHIHRAVTVYYPNAHTPSISVSRSEDEILVQYKSLRALSPLVQGMLEMAAELTGGEWMVERGPDVYELKPEGTFRLVKSHAMGEKS